MIQSYHINGQHLTPDQLCRIVQENMSIDLSQSAWQKVKKSRVIITSMMSDPNRVVYGINTGFGYFADKVITPQDRSTLQVNLIRSHAVGVGQPLPIPIVKKMFILRINTLSKGRSGISPQNLRKMINAYNAGFIPMIPQKGTVGASGDLAPLSHLALGMLGQGLAWNEKLKQFTDAGQLMTEMGLERIELHQKEGIALINGTQFMSSIISEVVRDSKRLLESAMTIYAFGIQVFGMDVNLFKPKMIAFYKQRNPTLGEVLEKISGYLNKDEPSELHKMRMKVNKFNKNCSSVLNSMESFAGFIEALNFCERLITEQMNSATDNPLVFGKEDGFQEDQLISAGNFHGQYVAKASDFLGMALFNLGRFSQARVQRYINGRTSDLPDFLIKFGGLNNGFMIPQCTSAALLSESKVLVKPASVDSISTSASQQDHVSMGGFAARKCKIILDNMAFILGIQLIQVLQAIDLLELKPSTYLQSIKEKVRKEIAFMQIDTYFCPEITIAHNMVLKGLK